MHRFYISQQFKDDSVDITDSSVIQQMRTVLRLDVGDEIIVFNGDGGEYPATIELLGKENVVLSLGKKKVCENELSTPVSLYVAMLKRDNLEFVVQKATELGISSITFLKTARTIVDELSPNKEQRYRHIIQEAVEQCGGCRVPSFAGVVDLETALKGCDKKDTLLFCHEKAKTMITSKLVSASNRVCLFIGPEGGFSDEEVALAKKKGAQIISLGDRVLRAETAAVTSIALCAYIIKQ